MFRGRQRDARASAFLHWCAEKKAASISETIDLGNIIAAYDWQPDRNEKEIREFLMDVIPRHESTHLRLLGLDQRYPIVLDFSTSEVMPSIQRLEVISGHDLTLKGVKIGSLKVFRPGRLTLDDCDVAEFWQNQDVGQGSPCSLTFRHTWIGEVTLLASSLHDLTIEKGCGILDFICPSPDEQIPFTGSVKISRDLFVPRSSKYPVGGAQPYRNLRYHLARLENAPAATFFHAAEESIDREGDDWFTRVLSYLYQWASGFGSSPGRPLLWILVLWLLNSAIVYGINGAELARETSAYFGWQEALTDQGEEGRVLRSLHLAAPRILNPFGIFGARALLVAKWTALNIWLSGSGIASAGLIALAILSIRRRFRLRG